MSRTNFYISEMEHFLAFLNKLPQAMVKEIENGEKQIEINIISSSKEPNEPMSENSIVVSEAITFLNSMKSREEASSYFSTNDLKRVDLEAICKQLDLPFTKKENMKTLQEKIIEGTVGYKLRSQAIQK